MENVPLSFRKWVKECVKEEFAATIEKELDKNKDSNDIAQRLIQSKEMRELMAGLRSVFDQRFSSSEENFESRPQTSISLASDLSGDEWSPVQTVGTDRFAHLINKISHDKPIHVRLAGYEAFMKSDMTNVCNSQCWEMIMKALRDGIGDDSQPIFEASLKAHAKLLNGSQAQQDVFTNLINSFNSLYHSKRLHSLLPTFVSGVNFRIFLHEKLLRISHLIIRHQEESLKSNRNTDKVLEEVLEQFVTFLGGRNSGNNDQKQILNVLNIVSILQPKSNWSKKWAHSLATMKILTSAIGKSPTMLKNILYILSTGLNESPTIINAHVTDDPPEASISGETIRTTTYLHCLCLVSELCGKSVGRQLLKEFQFDVPEFMISVLNSLNGLAASEVPHSIYDSSRSALQKLLDSPSVLYDARFHTLALDPLLRAAPDTERKIHPHTIDAMMRILDTEEGSRFMISNYAEMPISCTILDYTSDLLRQPLSIMNTEHVVHLMKFFERLFEYYDVCRVVRFVLRDQFYPAVEYLFDKMNNCSVENEIKRQSLDR